jgi:hypothetical protein
LHRIDGVDQLVPRMLNRRKEQRFLIPEVPIDSTFTNPHAVRNFLNVGLRIALGGKRLHRGVEDLQRSLGLRRVFSAVFGGRLNFHGTRGVRGRVYKKSAGGVAQ